MAVEKHEVEHRILEFGDGEVVSTECFTRDAGGGLRLQLGIRDSAEMRYYGPVLTVRNGAWRIDSNSGPLVGSGDSTRFKNESISILEGRNLTGLTISSGLDTTFEFDGVFLRVFPEFYFGAGKTGPIWSFTLGWGSVIHIDPDEEFCWVRTSGQKRAIDTGGWPVEEMVYLRKTPLGIGVAEFQISTLKEHVSALKDRRIGRVRWLVGSMFSVEFGDYAHDDTLIEAGGHSTLFIGWSAWRLSRSGRVIAGSGDAVDHIADSIQALTDRRLTGLLPVAASGEIAFNFDGLLLHIFPITSGNCTERTDSSDQPDDDTESWALSNPSGEIVVGGPGNSLSVLMGESLLTRAFSIWPYN